jgi:hypothetical protein
MAGTKTKRNCCLCDKLFREDERCRFLDNSKELLQYVVENDLLKLEVPLHNSCFMKLYAKKKNTVAKNNMQTENDSSMEVDIQSIDASTQTDPEPTLNPFLLLLLYQLHHVLILILMPCHFLNCLNHIKNVLFVKSILQIEKHGIAMLLMNYVSTVYLTITFTYKRIVDVALVI